MKYLIWFIFLTSIIFLTSCGKHQASYRYNINNQSDYTINVILSAPESSYEDACTGLSYKNQNIPPKSTGGDVVEISCKYTVTGHVTVRPSLPDTLSGAIANMVTGLLKDPFAKGGAVRIQNKSGNYEDHIISSEQIIETTTNSSPELTIHDLPTYLQQPVRGSGTNLQMILPNGQNVLKFGLTADLFKGIPAESSEQSDGYYWFVPQLIDLGHYSASISGGAGLSVTINCDNTKCVLTK